MASANPHIYRGAWRIGSEAGPFGVSQGKVFHATF